MGARGKLSKADKEVVEFRAARRGRLVSGQPEPKHLHAEGRAFYASMVEQHDITDAGRVSILTRAAEALDLIAECRAAIAKDGAFTETQYGTARAHPALAVRKDAVNAFLSCLRLLDLDAKHANLDRPGVPWGRGDER